MGYNSNRETFFFLCQIRPYPLRALRACMPISYKKKNFEILGSAHNLREIKIKERQGVGKVFLSPIFKKKGNNQLGIFRYLSLRKLSSMKDVALGGINNKNIKKFYLIKPFGFAGISYFT